MTTNEKQSSVFQYFLAPLIVGVAILAGQSAVQPIVAESTRAKTERWTAKRDTYVRAVELVNRKFDHLEWHGPDAAPNRDQLHTAPPPTSEEVNRVYAEILLYATHEGVLSSFLRCFGFGQPGNLVLQRDRIAMISEMRKDLGCSELTVSPENVKLFAKP
jgi:hypothetical protein